MQFILEFITHSYDFMTWLVEFDGSYKELERAIEDAANDWLHSKEGLEYIKKDDVVEWGVDYANVLQDCPQSYLFKRGVNVIPVRSYTLDTDENLLPYDLREEIE
jgi:hypothetical protein